MIQTFNYPHPSYERYNEYRDEITNGMLNTSLYQTVRENVMQDVSGGGYRTEWKFHERGYDDINTLLAWIKELIPKAAYVFANEGADISEYNPEELGFDPNAFKINECWGVLYNKGEGVIPHNHFPYAMSYCYFVNTPKGSTPLIIGEEEIQPVAGKIVFFLSHQYHEVLPTEADGRCVITGNILYTPPTVDEEWGSWNKLVQKYDLNPDEPDVGDIALAMDAVRNASKREKLNEN